MAKFYGQVFNGTGTAVTRTGARDIAAAVQSYNGSIITRMYYNGGELRVDVEKADGSSRFGRLIFSGTYEDFCKKLEA